MTRVKQGDKSGEKRLTSRITQGEPQNALGNDKQAATRVKSWVRLG